MGDEAPENEELVLTEEDQVQPPEVESEDEEIPTFGDTLEEEQDTDSATIRHLRQTLRQAQKELADARKSSPAPQAIEVGEKPTLSGCDYDEEKFEAELDQWKERKANADKQANASATQAEEQRKAMEARLSKLSQEKAALGRADADDALETVRAALGDAKFAGIAQLLDETTDSARFFYALNQSPAQLQALASQNDGIALVKQVTRLEGQLKMVKRRTPPAIDVPEKGSGKTSVTKNAAQKQLDKMEAEYKGGDRTHIRKFKKEHGLL